MLQITSGKSIIHSRKSVGPRVKPLDQKCRTKNLLYVPLRSIFVNNVGSSFEKSMITPQFGNMKCVFL